MGPSGHGPAHHWAHPADGGPHDYAAPRQCPVCGDSLALTRLGCRSCGTELSGSFEACEYCSLSPDDREMLAVFLSSRGNMKELERHLGVSYPTARARFEALLGRLGLGDGQDHDRDGGPTEVPPERPSEADILVRLAAGEIDIDTAERLIAAAKSEEEVQW
ncbi:MAG: DUF2089 domain-containing protein [Acidimicrobiales bacterium]